MKGDKPGLGFRVSFGFVFAFFSQFLSVSDIPCWRLSKSGFFVIVVIEIPPIWRPPPFCCRLLPSSGPPLHNSFARPKKMAGF
jgi:hypothetical protein